MPKLIAEACCSPADDVIEAQGAGVHRVGLNSNFSSGGLTLFLSTLEVAKVETGFLIMAMVRPRESALLYIVAESRIALLGAEVLLANDADGIVFGFLNSDDTVDAGRRREMLRPVGKSQTVFHRAIDVVPDWWAAIDLFCEFGVTRILTSGQRAFVFDGAATVAEIIRYAHGRIEVLPGGGIRMYNVQEIVSKTGCTQVYISPRRVCPDSSVLGNPETHFGLPGSHGDRYQVLDADKFEKTRNLACTD